MLFTCVCLTLVAVALASAQTSRPATAPASDDVDPLNATRYAELSDAEAWNLARRVLPEDTDAAPLEARRDAVKARASARAGAAKTKPGAPLAGDVHYLSNHSAVVRSAQPGKPGTFVASAAPLRAEDPEGRLRPVDLRLEPRGRAYLAPRNAGADVLVARSLRRNSLLRDIGLEVRPLVPRGSAVTARRAATAFFANAGDSTDVTLSAAHGGLETMWVLRSRTSPERLRLKLRAPGLRVTPRRHGAFLLRGAKRRKLAIVTPAVAWDANGKPVAVRASHAGSTLRYDVAHRAEEVRYPIVVDPVITDDYTGATGTDYAGWSPLTPTPAGHGSATTGTSGNGLYLSWAGANTTTPGSHEWRFTAPSTSIITRFVAGQVVLRPTGGQTCATLGVKSSAHASLAGGTEMCPALPTGQTSVAVPGQTFTPTGGAIAANKSNYAYLAHTPKLGSTASSAFMQLATIDLADIDNPVITGVGVNPATGTVMNGWLKTQDVTLTPAVTDSGLGMQKVTVTRPDNGSALQTFTHGCTGMRASRCPLAHTPPITFNTTKLEEGVRPVSLTAHDVVQNQSAAVTANVKVDRTVAWSDFNGDLAGWPFLSGGAKNIEVRAWDGDTTQTRPEHQESGVYQIKAWINSTLLGDHTQTCATGHGCSMARTFSVSPAGLAHGAHTFKAEIRDFAQNVETRTARVFVDTQGPKVTLSGPLKDAVASGTPLNKESYRLHIDAVDGLPGGLERQSGMNNIEVMWEDNVGVRRSLDKVVKPCDTDSCPMELDYTFEPRRFSTAGKIVVRATDDMTYYTDSLLNVTPAATQYDTSSLSGLEEFFQFDNVPTGAGTRAHVNQTTGNLVWHHVPMVNPGRGLATFANLTYNSQTRKGDATFTPYNQAGEGFSFGISGLTRVNEPMDLSKETTGEISITDVDGTRHLFKKVTAPNGAVYYEPPPGVNLHLRKFNSGDWARVWAATRPDGVTHFFDRRGFQTYVQDRNENLLRFEYEIVPIKPAVSCPAWGFGDVTFASTDCRQRLTAVTDAAGVVDGSPNRRVTLAYAANDGPVTTVTDHAGRQLAFLYSGGKLTELTQAANTPEARTFRFLYGPYGMASVKDPRGNETRFTYGTGYTGRFSTASPVVDSLSDARIESVLQRDGRHRAYAYELAPSGSLAQWRARATDARSETTLYDTDHRGRTLLLTDPLGVPTKLLWDTDNNVTKISEADGTTDVAVTNMGYNENGLLEWISDPLDHRTELEYISGEGQHVTTETLGEGRQDFVSDLNRIDSPKGTATGDPDDFAELFEVDRRGNVTARRDAAGNWAHTEFDRFGRVLKEVDQMGHATRYEQHDDNGQPRVMIDAKGGRSEYHFDVVGNLLATSDARAAEFGGLRDPKLRFQTRFEYDGVDQLVKEILPKDSRAGQFITRSYEYDVNGNGQRSVDGNEAASTQVFDEMDRPIAMKTPAVPHADEEAEAPEIARRAYDGAGNVIHEQMPRGEEDQDTDQDFSTDYEYDAKGQLVVVRRHEVKTPATRTTLVTSMAYDKRGNLLHVSDPKQNAKHGKQPLETVTNSWMRRWSFEYDKADRMIRQYEDPGMLWLRTAFEYDRNDNVTKVVDPRWHETRREYDARDLLVAEIDQISRKTVYERRADGLVTAIVSPRAHAENAPAVDYRERLTYDPLGAVIERRLPRWAGGNDPATPYTWRYVRDAVGNPVTVTDPRGHSYANTFYDSGDLKSTTRPSMWSASAGGVAPKSWRALGNEAQKPDLPDSQGQGDFGAVSGEPMPGLFPKAGPVDLAYDNEMRLKSVTERTSGTTTALERDALGRVLSLTRPHDKAANRSPIVESMAYDRNGNVTLSIDGAKNATRTTYDQFDRPIAVARPGSGDGSVDTTRFTYDANGKTTSVESPRGPKTLSCYDAVDRLVESIDPLGRRSSRRYDEAGNLVYTRSPKGAATASACPSSIDAITAAGPFITTRSYDGAGQLEKLVEGITGEKETTYKYDPDGNLIEIDAPGAKASGATAAPLERRVTKRAFDARGNVYREVTGTAVTGNPAKRRVTIREYDGIGNLRRVVNPKGMKSSVDEPLKGNATTLPHQTTIESQADRDHQGVIDATEHATLFEYSPDNLLTSVHLPHAGDGRWRQTFAHDARGRVQHVDAAHEWSRGPGVCTDDSVDPAFEKTAASQPNCIQRTTYTHYDTGWIKTATDPEGRHPERGELGGEIHSYDYDERGLQTRWDVRNRNKDLRRSMLRTYWPSGLLKHRDADRAGDAPEDKRRAYDYRYSPNGQLTSVLDAAKDLTTPADDRIYRMAYDAADRLVATDEDDVGSRQGTDSFFRYDAHDNLVLRKVDGKFADRVKPSGDLVNENYSGGTSTSFSYDDWDREIESRVDRPGDKFQIFRTDYWPSDDRRTRWEETLARPAGSAVTPRITEKSFWGNDGMATKLERYRNGVATAAKDQTYTHDLNGNREEDETGRHVFNARDQHVIWHRRNNGPRVEYTVSGGGDVTKKTDYAGGTTKTTENRFAAGRLIESATKPANATTWQKLRYGYDTAAANVMSISTSNVTAGADGKETEQPEADRKQIAEFKYDSFDRLTEEALIRAKDSRGPEYDDKDVDVYEHDGFDRRDTVTEKWNRPPAAPTERKAGFSYIGITEALSKRGPLHRSETKTSSYDYDSGGDILGMSRLAAPTTTTPNPSVDQYRSYGKDINGSIEGLTDEGGNEVQKYRYDPYGNAVDSAQNEQSGTTIEDSLTPEGKDNPIRFQGFYFGSGVKTYDMHARSYLPSAGRFLTQDRFESATGDFNLVSDPLTQNRYAFAGGNPINNVEFDGHEPAEGSYVNAPTDYYGKRSRSRRAKRQDAARQQRATSAAQTTTPDAVDRNTRSTEDRVNDRALRAVSIRKTREHLAKGEVGPGGLRRSRLAYPNQDPETPKPDKKGGNIVDFAGGATCEFTIVICFGDQDTRAADGGQALAILNPKGLFQAGAKKGVKEAGEELFQKGCSFTGRTLVLMADGRKVPIEEVDLGDWVVSTDPLTGETRAVRVENVIVGGGLKRLVTVDAAGTSFVTTDNHPFWVVNKKRWMLASALEVGDVLLGPDGRWITVTALSEQPAMTQWVYNLDVGGFSTFYVGEQPVLVHNQDACSRVRPINGQTPINSKYAGDEFPLKEFDPGLAQKYPRGVHIKGSGFPDFAPYKQRQFVADDLAGGSADIRRANKAAFGTSRQPKEWKDWTWHHVEDGRTLQLVPKDLHDAVRHHGGTSVIKAGG